MLVMAKDLPPHQTLDIISELISSAAGKKSQQEIADLVIQYLTRQLGFSSASLFLLSADQKEDVIHGLLYSQPLPEIEAEEVQFPAEPTSLPGWIWHNQQSKVIHDFQNEISFAKESLSGIQAEAGIPVAANHILLGILFVLSDQADGFPEYCVAALNLLGNSLATILENLQLRSTAQETRQSTSILKQYSQSILLAKNEEEVIKNLLAALATTPYLTGVYSVEKDHLSVVGINDPYAPHTKSSFEGIALPLHNIAEKLPQDDVLLIEDLSKVLHFKNLASFYSRHEYQSSALYSIYEVGSLSKIIVVSSPAPEQLSLEDILIFDELIKSTRRSLSQFKEIKHLQHQLAELSTLQQVSKAVSAETNLQTLYQVLHQEIMRSIGSDLSFLVATYDHQTRLIHVPYLFEDGARQEVEPFPLGEGLTSFLLTSKKPLLVNENAKEKFTEIGARFLGKPSKSWLGVPLLIEGEAVGALIVQDMRKERRFSENDLNLLSTIAPHIALALRTAQTVTEMQNALVAYDQESYLLNALLGNIPERVYFLDEQGRYTRVSQSFAELQETADPASLIGRSLTETALFRNNPSFIEQDRNILQTRKATIGVVEQTLDQDGNPHYSLNSRIPLTGRNGQPNGILGISQNIDTLKQTEQVAEERAQRLEIASAIAREASSVLAVEQILNTAVNLVRDRFGYYHASVFQIDPLGEYAILQEAAGEIGAEMKRIGHKLAVGSKSLVGQATSLGVPVVIDDVTADPNYYPNPLLPETRSEMVVPIQLGSRILGALDVQSKQTHAFSPEVVNVLRILADQLATASSNAMLFGVTQENLKKNRMLNQIATSAASSPSLEEALVFTAQGLKELFTESNVAIFLFNPDHQLEFRAAAGFEGLHLTGLTIEKEYGLFGKALTENEPLLLPDLRNYQNPGTISEETQSLLLIPFRFSGETLGLLCLESSQTAAFDQNDQEIMVNFGNMLAAIVFNNKLLQQLRRQSDKQQALFEITNKIRQTVEMQSILQTSVAEICKAVGAKRARIEISVPESGTVPLDLLDGEEMNLEVRS